MPTVMVTGVNRGLGLEFIKRYAAHHCLGGSTAGDRDRLVTAEGSAIRESQDPEHNKARFLTEL
jgi:NAD(P)-dependent dehydrogenase (short-subunit alcohol dehydrogenase family)